MKNENIETRVFGGRNDKSFWSDKPIQDGHPNEKNNYFTFGGKNNDEKKVFYNSLPEEILKVLDTSITQRAVHLGSNFANAALRGGYDPEKVSRNTLVAKGLLKDI